MVDAILVHVRLVRRRRLARVGKDGDTLNVDPAWAVDRAAAAA